jgi:hypothetical protein
MGLVSMFSTTSASAATCTVGAEHRDFFELHCTGTKFDGTGWQIRYKDNGGGTAFFAPEIKHRCPPPPPCYKPSMREKSGFRSNKSFSKFSKFGKFGPRG